MTNVRKNEKNARALGITLEEFEMLVIRIAGYLKKRPINLGSVSESFFILTEILEEHKTKQAEKWKTSNSEMRERGTEIEQLRNDGKGYGSIKKELSLNVSRGTIATFCIENNLNKENKDG